MKAGLPIRSPDVETKLDIPRCPQRTKHLSFLLGHDLTSIRRSTDTLEPSISYRGDAHP
ncbi:MAG: hypothetical protein QGG23_08395 [Candidatus Bathyarchaeota archaeon]|nr:hypothetical protein [Candidatus Bathyarchaeota archaeon]